MPANACRERAMSHILGSFLQARFLGPFQSELLACLHTVSVVNTRGVQSAGLSAPASESMTERPEVSLPSVLFTYMCTCAQYT